LGGVVCAPGWPGFCAPPRVRALSDRGSMKTPTTESTVVTVATFCWLKSTVMMRAVT